MTTCPRCGHTVEVGRFCTNCGAAVGGGPDRDRSDRSDTAERPAVPPTPPPLPPAPSAARYPLFADEVDAAPAPTPASAPAREPAPTGRPSHRGGHGWVVWIVVAAVLVVVGLVGASLLLAGNDDEQADDPASSTPTTDNSDGRGDGRGDGNETPDGQESEEPPADPGEPTDVAADATAEVPATAPPGTDVDGARIGYDAAQMLDGDPTTCWRMTGDGTGREIVLTLAEPTVVTELGLINGYAKTARDAKGRDLDWYAGNRRVRTVQWVLDDGTVVDQDLDETRDLQTVGIEPVETSTVVLRLVEVSGPGRGRSARDNTAVSELSVVGTPA